MLNSPDQAADAAAAAPLLQEVKQTTRHERLISTAAEIALMHPAGDDMGFTHAVLCQVGLPRSKVGGRDFLRRSGDAWVSVQAGMLDEGNAAILNSKIKT